ncbi:DUF6571 family protein [Streptacidiphilus neutrinimicus]|uniref:DUF6571 family protein n=1 Tax=Streptacidiphilus neutrinimicus TaxID=105420 RepID=UPI001269E41F|nr:DUF6571 family protein [Streptacidiphilus neutrinimicus]
MTYDQLAYLKLDQLDAAASSFEKLVRGWDLESEYESQVIRPLAGSNWTGPSADAAAGTLTQTRTQITDAFDEASSLARVLRDLHDQLTAAQRILRQVVSDAESQGLTVDDGGAVHWPPPKTQADRHDPDYASSYSELASGIADRLTAVLQTATEADSAAAAAFAADTGSSTTSFSAKPVGGMSEQEAAQAAALAKEGGFMSDAQLSQLDALMKAHANDPRFATALYQNLGPQESLLFFGQLSWGSAGNGARNDPARLALLKTLQAQMGTSLAAATNLGNWPHLDQAWVTGLQKAGNQQMQLDMNNPNDPQSKVYGYQLLSSYLRTGSYDSHFLVPIAQDITNLSKADPTRWINQSLQGTNNRINFLDASAGYNPMTGVLQGLGHSPDAATQFLHTPGNLDYLTSVDNKNVMLFTDCTGVGPDSYKAAHAAQINALGDALQAATTGIAYDAPSGTPLPQHTQAMSDIAGQVLDKFGAHPEWLSGENGNAYFPQLNTSVSHIAASYIGDLDRALNGTSTHIPTYGVSAQVDSGHAAALLHALGRDPDAYGAVLQAQNAYTAVQLQNCAKANPHNAAELANIAEHGAMANGILSQARVQELQQNSAATDAQYNAAIDRNTGIANTVWSMTGGTLAGRVPVVGGYINSGVSGYINAMGASFHQDHTLQAIQGSYSTDMSALHKTQDAARQAVLHALGPGAVDAADSAATGAENGYTAGAGFGTRAQG